MQILRPLATLAAALLPACAGTPHGPLPVAREVDLDRFLGTWYVIASTPLFVDDEAWGATETYRRNPDGSIATTYAFRDGGPEGPEKVYTPTAFVPDPANPAVWEMQFVWPFRSEYVIAHVDPTYSESVIARTARDYVWIMARTPRIPDADYERLAAFVSGLGYDASGLRRVPQPEAR